jgi:integrase
MKSPILPEKKFDRAGLPLKTECLVREVIAPEHKLNPWPIQVRERNQIAITMMLDQGLRTDELLAIRLKDIDFKGQKIIIQRNKQPSIKEYSINIPSRLCESIKNYISEKRSQYPGAKNSDFLFISSSNLSQFSHKSLHHICKAVSEIGDIDLKHFSPVFCRRTWFTRNLKMAMNSTSKAADIQSE